MSLKNPLTEQEVRRAANEIAATGEMPTIAAVREYVGNRGSETTILNYLSKWKTDLLKYSQLSPELALNAEAVIAYQAENKLLWQELHNLREKFALIKHELQKMNEHSF